MNFTKKGYPPGVPDFLNVNRDQANNWPKLKEHKIKANSEHTKERLNEAVHRRHELEGQLRNKLDNMARRKDALRMLVRITAIIIHIVPP